MDKTTLVEPDIEIGRRITEALDQSNVRVRASLWLYTPEAEEWRLLVATPLVDERGSRATYSAIQKSIKQIDFPLRKIAVISPSDPFIRMLRQAIRTGPGISGIRFTHNTIGDVFIEDAYIYRVM